MVHGWPSLWHSWKFQIEEFKNDYHLIIPDIRGFGSSGHPDDVRTSGNWPDIVGDLLCVLEHEGISNAVCMGHDWGSALCYQAARMRPDIFTAVVGAAIPYIPDYGPYTSPRELIQLSPRLAYQIFLGETPEAATTELDADIRRSLRATLRTVASPPPASFLTDEDSFLHAWENVTVIPPIPFFTSEEEDYWVEQYGIQGFKNTLQFYTPGNQKSSWQFIHDQGNYTIPQATLAILPDEDPVADWGEAMKLLGSAKFIPHLETHFIQGAHWLQLENHEKFNSIARPWLDALPTWSKKGEQMEKDGTHGRPVDEL